MVLTGQPVEDLDDRPWDVVFREGCVLGPEV